MSFIKSIKNAFGFSDAESQEAELEGIDATVVPLKSRSESFSGDSEYESVDTVGSDSDNSSAAEDVDRCIEPEPVPQAIFETVVKVFNESLPEFLRQGVNEKLQCDYLYGLLDDSIKLYIEQVASDARKRVANRWEVEKNQLQAQLSTLRTKMQKDEEDGNELKRQKLSAERQKRALGDRVRDLETQLQKAEAEMEQLTLENKSMANKLRVSSVLGPSADGDVEATDMLVKKVDELTEALNEAESRCNDAKSELVRIKSEFDATQKTLDSSKQDIATAEDARKAAAEDAANCRKELDEANATADSLREKIKTLEDALATTRVADNDDDAKLSELNSRLCASTDALESAQQRVCDVEAENARLKQECEELNNELSEANKNLSVVDELCEQISGLEEAKKSHDSIVKKFKSDLQLAQERIAMLEGEKEELKETLEKKESSMRHMEDIADSLKKTIERNLYEHAQTQAALKDEINRLKSVEQNSGEAVQNVVGGELGSGLNGSNELDESKPSPGKSVDENKKSPNKRIKISAIDESLEDTDWLVATPPEPRKDENNQEDADFGYKPPQKKAPANNPDQMTLF